MSLEALGLAPGMRVRFRRDPTRRWQAAVLERREADGSLGLRDGRALDDPAVAIGSYRVRVHDGDLQIGLG